MKILYRLVFISLLFLGFISCERNDNELKVTYQVTESDSGFDVYYLDENDELIYEEVITNSEEDEWIYSFTGERGDVVYVSTIYYDINSKVKVRIFLDEKVYKEGISRYDTASFLVVSGTIPYN